MSYPAYFQRQFLPLDQAQVNIATHALNYGTGCFEGIRAYFNPDQGQLYIFRLREHYERFLNSCRIMRIDPGHTVEELMAVTVELLRRHPFQEDVYIRPLAFKADPVIKVTLDGIGDALGIFAVPLGDYLPTDGIRVTVSSWRRTDDNAIPARAKITGSYVNTALSVSDAHAGGYDDCIMLTEDGHVSEGSAANLLMVRDGRIATPPVTDNLLEGITRDSVLRLARDLGYAVEERHIDRTELFVADELMLTGTGVQVAPIVAVDGRPVGRGTVGPVAARLQAAYFDVVRGRDPRYGEWLTPVE
ncbi:putative branched-chain-amino-acid aminotransferase [Candidatus Hydrogenisulfobacillus filiaventi]|uniref:Branched-chain-amino-acid aminotransferase n=1 Tax=Candidatus Hydrogenisulfobacillus filiaventi TaxID=2707344 RepID=A0A6F8ZIN8_9FIRM|nr:branched-chain amino acid transaminase [Bacillota bacterium]CAB1129802.1 putative branched-chain-amino-acid aminotransferase [Candidatus Hydrogenisulfobacillus filiaventi]